MVVPALIDKSGARSCLITAYNFRIPPSFSLKRFTQKEQKDVPLYRARNILILAY
jgi:hypothetical protein